MLAPDLDLANLKEDGDCSYTGTPQKSELAPFVLSMRLTLMVLVGRRLVVEMDSQYLIASFAGAATDCATDCALHCIIAESGT